MDNKSTGLQNTFGKRIKKLRQKIGWSQEELGFETNLDRTYISGIERGVRNPSLKNIGKIAKALKIPISDLFKTKQ